MSLITREERCRAADYGWETDGARHMCLMRPEKAHGSLPDRAQKRPRRRDRPGGSCAPSAGDARHQQTAAVYTGEPRRVSGHSVPTAGQLLRLGRVAAAVTRRLELSLLAEPPAGALPCPDPAHGARDSRSRRVTLS